jgi:hypothetical protein
MASSREYAPNPNRGSYGENLYMEGIPDYLSSKFSCFGMTFYEFDFYLDFASFEGIKMILPV